MISALDIFRIGIGPSSSHTVGPMRIASRFLRHLSTSGTLTQVATIMAYMQGSLAYTGKGHRTPEAITLGLMGFQAETTDPEQAEIALARVRQSHKLVLPHGPEILFNPDVHLIADYETIPTLHPNGLRLRACDKDGVPLADKIYYSTGGGFIASQRQLETPVLNDLVSTGQEGPFAFSSGAQ